MLEDKLFSYMHFLIIFIAVEFHHIPGGFFFMAGTPVPPASNANQSEARSDPPATQTQTSTTRGVPLTGLGHAFTGQGPSMMPAVRHLIPVPLSSMGSLQTFDSALPCHSVWALDTSRRRHNAGPRTAVSSIFSLLSYQ